MNIKFSKIKLLLNSINKLHRHVKNEDLKELEIDLSWALNVLKLKWSNRLKQGSESLFDDCEVPVAESATNISFLLKRKSDQLSES